MDAVSVADRFGIDRNRAVTYECDSEGTQLNYEVLSKAVSRVRACEAPSAAMAFDECSDWAAEIHQDFKKRHKRKKETSYR